MTNFEVGKFYKHISWPSKYECLAVFDGWPVFVNVTKSNPPFVATGLGDYIPWPKEKVKKEGWVSICKVQGKPYCTNPYPTENDARKSLMQSRRIAVIKIEWEEEVEE